MHWPGVCAAGADATQENGRLSPEFEVKAANLLRCGRMPPPDLGSERMMSGG